MWDEISKKDGTDIVEMNELTMMKLAPFIIHELKRQAFLNERSEQTIEAFEAVYQEQMAVAFYADNSHCDFSAFGHIVKAKLDEETFKRKFNVGQDASMG